MRALNQVTSKEVTKLIVFWTGLKYHLQKANFHVQIVTSLCLSPPLSALSMSHGDNIVNKILIT